MIRIAPRPGWQARFDRLTAIYNRACAELGRATGMPELIAQAKCRVAYRQIQALLAMRPPARAVERETKTMFADLQRQVTLEAQRQHGIALIREAPFCVTASSNDNGQGASTEKEKANGIREV